MHGEHLNAGTSISAFVKADSEDCKAIWLACFPGDTPEVPERFFRDVVGPEEGLVYRIDGRPVSMVFMLPSALAGEGERLFLSAITSGGSQAVFFKINTVGEENFLDKFVDAVNAYSAHD